jgi:hypothetical protein
MHSPGYFREAFAVALDGYLYANDSSLDGFFYDDATTQRLWDGKCTEDRLWWIAGKLWRCTDILPSSMCSDLDMLPGSTYAQACRRIRQELVAPLVPV